MAIKKNNSARDILRRLMLGYLRLLFYLEVVAGVSTALYIITHKWWLAIAIMPIVLLIWVIGEYIMGFVQVFIDAVLDFINRR